MKSTWVNWKLVFCHRDLALYNPWNERKHDIFHAKSVKKNFRWISPIRNDKTPPWECKTAIWPPPAFVWASKNFQKFCQRAGLIFLRTPLPEKDINAFASVCTPLLATIVGSTNKKWNEILQWEPIQASEDLHLGKHIFLGTSPPMGNISTTPMGKQNKQPLPMGKTNLRLFPDECR